jgi:hypothetical protein
MSVDSLHAALRRKFKTSADAMHALGLSPSLLHERTIPMTRRYAHDAARLRRFGGDAEPLSVPDFLAAVRELIGAAESPDDCVAALSAELENDIIGGDPDNPPETAEDKRRRAARGRLGMDDGRRRQPTPAEEKAFLGRYDVSHITVM